MPGYKPNTYHDKTQGKVIKARMKLETEGKGKSKELTKQQKKDYSTLSKASHKNPKSKKPTSQELQNVYSRAKDW